MDTHSQPVVSGRARPRDERGYITPVVFGMMLLMSALALTIAGAAANSQASTRTARSQIAAQTNADTATAAAMAALNAGMANLAPITSAVTYSTGPGSVVSGAPVPDSGNHASTYDYVFSPTDQPDRLLLRVTGRYDDKSYTVGRPVRAHFVGSVSTAADGTRTYGVTASGPVASWDSAGAQNPLYQGAWGAPVASATDSTFYGTVKGFNGMQGEWHLYGGKVTVNNTPTFATAFADGATMTNGTTAVPVQRSNFNAFLDRQNLNQRTSAPFYGSSACALASSSTPVFPSGSDDKRQLCADGQSTPFVLSGATPYDSQSVASSLNVKGDLILNGDISFTGRLHIYVTGNVSIARGASETGVPVRTLDKVYIYAPNGTCSTSNVRLNMVGSLACNKIQMTDSPTNQVQWRPPFTVKTIPNITTPSLVFYTEEPGFADFIGSANP